MEKLQANQEGRESVKNWDELYSLVESGAVKTSQGETYSTENFNEAVDVARATRFGNMNLFTRSEGLRENAACLFIEEVETFEELYNLLTHIETISGSAGNTYTREELTSQIQSIEGIIAAQDDIWEMQLQKLTRTFGLRDAVTRCLEARN